MNNQSSVCCYLGMLFSESLSNFTDFSIGIISGWMSKHNFSSLVMDACGAGLILRRMLIKMNSASWQTIRLKCLLENYSLMIKNILYFNFGCTHDLQIQIVAIFRKKFFLKFFKMADLEKFKFLICSFWL